MNTTEFNVWIADYQLAFPETAAWLANIEPDSQVELLGKWRQVFAGKRITLELGREVTAAMISGDVPSVAAYERELTAAKVVAGAREMRMQRGDAYRSEADVVAQRATERNRTPYERPATAISVWEMVEGYKAMKKGGASQRECDAWLDQKDRESFPR